MSSAAPTPSPAPIGRGARINPANRFECFEVAADPDFVEFDEHGVSIERPQPHTPFFDDASESILTPNDAPPRPQPRGDGAVHRALSRAKWHSTRTPLKGTMALLSLKCYSLLLGARHTCAAGATFSAEDDARIRTITARHFPDGFSVVNASGGWFDAARREFVEESTRQVLVHTTRPAALRPWCDELGTALGQRELMLVEVGPAALFKVG